MRIDLDGLYKKYGPMVYRRCRYLLGSDEEAQDAMQEVFMALAKRRDMEIEYPSSLLFRIATNVSVSMLRKRKNAPAPLCELLMETVSSGDDHARDLEVRDLLDRAFSSEKESTRTIAVLHFVDRMTYEEVAGEVGLSVSGVRRRLSKLKEKLQGLEIAGGLV